MIYLLLVLIARRLRTCWSVIWKINVNKTSSNTILGTILHIWTQSFQTNKLSFAINKVNAKLQPEILESEQSTDRSLVLLVDRPFTWTAKISMIIVWHWYVKCHVQQLMSSLECNNYLSSINHLFFLLNLHLKYSCGLVFYYAILVMSEWLLFNVNSTMFQLYHGEKHVNFQWDDDEVHFVLDQHA
jgi:hypothetical protein